MKVDPLLVSKYNVPAPRYTSYPTVPFWNDHIDVVAWKDLLKQRFDGNTAGEGISLYIHLPFCESLCTYCGCNKKITTNHAVEELYLQAVLKEWRLYRGLMDRPPVIREIHLGGGTPTFFSAGNLMRLVEAILQEATVHPQHEFSLEGHPNNTTAEHLRMLYALGFRRISYGVQDNNPDVQLIINRIQPFENVQRATDIARQAGFTSVNFDLIYGLPLQDKMKLANTVLQCISLRPDRIAFYSYAHVPWVSRGQRLFDERDLPSAGEKLALYMKGRDLFAANGYADIGMDHFALPSDELYKSWQQGALHRNFMGYTSHATGLLLGLGVSAISDAGDAFAQNNKTLSLYYQSINAGQLAVDRGYFLSEEDKEFRRHILDITCKGSSRFSTRYLPVIKDLVWPALTELQHDGLVNIEEEGVEVTAQGRYFLRNICKAFDLTLARSQALNSKGPLFSKAV